MLGWLRTRTQNIFIYAIFAVIILAFTFSLGGGGSLTSSRNPNNIAAVYGQVIDRRAYANALTDQERRFRQIFGDDWTEDKFRQLQLPQRVLAEMENQMLMRHAAEEMGLGITDTELRDAIVNLPAFNTNGHFDYDRYKRALALQRRSPKQFEASIRIELLVQKINDFFNDSVHVSRGEALEAYKKDRERIDLEYVAFDLKGYKQKISPTQEEIEAFEKDQAGRIELYYETHPSDYKRPEQVRAAHILIKLPQDATADEAKAAEAEAQRIAEKARKRGADFAALAKENSQDTVTAPAGGELGWISRGQMVKPFEDAAFDAKPGSIAGPVKTTFGYHVLKIADRREAIDRKLAEARGEIARMLFIEDRALADAEGDARGLLEKAADSTGLASLERPRGARHGSTGRITRGVGEIPGLGPSGEIEAIGFRLTSKAPLAPEPVRAGDSIVVLHLKEIVLAPPNPPAQDLDPYRQRLLADKREKAIALWLRSAREEAERKGEMERNETALRDFMGS